MRTCVRLAAYGVCLLLLLPVASAAGDSSGWAFLRHAGVTPRTNVMVVERARIAGKSWTLLGFGATDHWARNVVCTYLVVGPIHGTAWAGSCGLAASDARHLIEFVRDRYGIGGAVDTRVAQLEAISSSGQTARVRLVPGPRVLRLTARFFALHGQLPATFVALDSKGRVLQRLPV
jgi:hypothetical protein